MKYKILNKKTSGCTEVSHLLQFKSLSRPWRINDFYYGGLDASETSFSDVLSSSSRVGHGFSFPKSIT